jgi:hypothetical protein
MPVWNWNLTVEPLANMIMKKQNLIAFAAVAILLAACIPSVNPFYTDKDVVFDQHLIGEWVDKSNPDALTTWKFEQATNRGFLLTVTGEGKMGEFSAHLFKLKQEQFLDIIPYDWSYPTNQSDIITASMFPGHLLLHVAQIEPVLKLSFCNFDWLGSYLEKNPKALAHHVESPENTVKEARLILTADTADLQKFVLKHLGTNELFRDYSSMTRQTK